MLQNTLRFICIYLLLASCSGNSSEKQKAQQYPKLQKDQLEHPDADREIILFYGNSITAGYGLELSEAFPALIQKRLDSLGYAYRAINAGLSGETTAGGLNRIEWVLKTVPDIFILELGANDGLRGLDLNETRKNLIAIINKVKDSNPDVIIIVCGMEVPPNLGQDYTAQFRKIFPQVAKETGSELIPFLLKGVAGEAELNLSDGIHPTPEGHQIVMETVWQTIFPLLVKRSR